MMDRKLLNEEMDKVTGGCSENNSVNMASDDGLNIENKIVTRPIEGPGGPMRIPWDYSKYRKKKK